MIDGVILIVLAAGGSKRLGRPKQLLTWRGQTLLRRATRVALELSQPVIVILGHHADACRRELDGLDVRISINPEWEKGLGTSIATAMWAIDSGAINSGNIDQGTIVARAQRPEAVLLMLCDQPLINADHLRAICILAAGTNALVVPTGYEGVRGVPALFKQPLFDALRLLSGPTGAKKVIESHAQVGIEVPLAAAGVDIDTQADFDRLQDADFAG